MIGARVDLKRLFERFNRFLDVAPIELEDSAVIKRIGVSRHAGSPGQSLVANREVGANPSDDLSLLRELIKQAYERIFCGNEILPVEHSKRLLKRADCSESSR